MGLSGNLSAESGIFFGKFFEIFLGGFLMQAHHRHRPADNVRDDQQISAEFAKEFLGGLVQDYRAAAGAGVLVGWTFFAPKVAHRFVVQGLTVPDIYRLLDTLRRDELLSLMLECAGVKISPKEFRERLMEPHD